jgi:anti-anti-sigma factor
MSSSPMADQTSADRRPDGADAVHLSVVMVQHGHEVVAHVGGDIDMATCERLRDAIEPHLGPGQQVVLDLSGVTFMDSSCLAVLESARTKLTEDGGSLVLRNPSRAAHRLLSVAGMSKLFAIQIG